MRIACWSSLAFYSREAIIRFQPSMLQHIDNICSAVAWLLRPTFCIKKGACTGRQSFPSPIRLLNVPHVFYIISPSSSRSRFCFQWGIAMASRWCLQIRVSLLPTCPPPALTRSPIIGPMAASPTLVHSVRCCANLDHSADSLNLKQ